MNAYPAPPRVPYRRINSLKVLYSPLCLSKPPLDQLVLKFPRVDYISQTSVAVTPINT